MKDSLTEDNVQYLSHMIKISQHLSVSCLLIQGEGIVFHIHIVETEFAHLTVLNPVN
jgi:hypothetical protein